MCAKKRKKQHRLPQPVEAAEIHGGPESPPVVTTAVPEPVAPPAEPGTEVLDVNEVSGVDTGPSSEESNGSKADTIEIIMPDWNEEVFKIYLREKIGFDPDVKPADFFGNMDAKVTQAAVVIRQKLEKANLKQCAAVLDPDDGDIEKMELLFPSEIDTPNLLSAKEWLEKLQERRPNPQTKYWMQYLGRLWSGTEKLFKDLLDNKRFLTGVVETRLAEAKDEEFQERIRREGVRAEIIDETIAREFRELSELPNALPAAVSRAEHGIYAILAHDKNINKTNRANVEFIERQLAIWRGVIIALTQEKQLEISEDDLNGETKIITQERADKKEKFRYNAYKAKRVEWVRELSPNDLLDKLGLPESGPAADKFLEAADFFEAVRRVVSKRETEEREKRRREDEAQKKQEQAVEDETKDIGMLAAKAEFFALATILHSGEVDAEATILDYLQTKDPKEKKQKLRKLFIAAVTERGISVPGTPFRNLETGETMPVTWDRVSIKRDNEGGFTNVYGTITADNPAEHRITIHVYDPRAKQWKGEISYSYDQLTDRPQYAQPSSLDGRATIALAKLVGIELRSQKNLHFVLAGNFKPGTLAVNTGRRHGIEFDNGYDYLPSGETVDLENSKYIFRQKAMEYPKGTASLFKDYRILMTSGASVDSQRYLEILQAIKPDQMTLLADHHTLTSTKESSGVRYIYDLLDAIDCFEDKDAQGRKWTDARKQALKRAIEQVQYEDNKSHPDWGKDWAETSHKTILGLMRRLTLEKLMEFFEKHPGKNSETKKLNPDELEDLQLAQASEAQKDTVRRAQERLAGLEQQGFVLRDTKYGTVVVLTSEPIQRMPNGKYKIKLPFFPGMADAIHGLLNPNSKNPSALLIWNPWEGRGKDEKGREGKKGRFFLATDGQPIEDLRRWVGPGERVRGTMWHGQGIDLGLKEFISDKLAGSQSLDIRGGLAEYCKRERNELRRVRGEKEIERETRQAILLLKAPELFGPTPLERDENRVIVPRWWTGGKLVDVILPRTMKPEDIDSQKRYRLQIKLLEYPTARLGFPKYTVEVIGEHPNANLAREYEEKFKIELKQQLSEGEKTRDAWNDKNPKDQDATVTIIAAREIGKMWKDVQSTLTAV